MQQLFSGPEKPPGGRCKHVIDLTHLNHNGLKNQSHSSLKNWVETGEGVAAAAAAAAAVAAGVVASAAAAVVVAAGVVAAAAVVVVAAAAAAVAILRVSKTDIPIFLSCLQRHLD